MEFAPLNPKLQVAVENYIEMIRALELQVKSSPLLETILDKLVRTKSYLQLAQSTIAEFELGAQGLLSSSDCTGASPQVTPALSDGNDNSVSSHGVSSTSLITAAVNRVPSDSQEDFSIVKKLSSGAATSPPSLRNKNLKQAVKTLKAKPYTSPELDILRGFELFKSFPEECLTRVSRWAMEIRKASGDVIVSRGDQSHELFFLVDGRVVVLDANGDEISSLGMGSFFGEIGFCK